MSTEFRGAEAPRQQARSGVCRSGLFAKLSISGPGGVGGVSMTAGEPRPTV